MTLFWQIWRDGPRARRGHDAAISELVVFFRHKEMARITDPCFSGDCTRRSICAGGTLLFFIATKIFGLIFEPVNFIVLALAAGVILQWCGWKRTGTTIRVIMVASLLVICFSPLSRIMLRVLEDRFPQPAEPMLAPAGIIVLGGSIDQEVSATRGTITIGKAAARLTMGAALARRFPAARLLFTGGPSDLRRRGRDEAEGVHQIWTSLGVPEMQMTFENQSRNTFENAVFTRDLVAPKPGEIWLLVTSAAHMPRSAGIFRHAGFAVVPYPVDYQTLGDGRDWRWNLNGLRALDQTDTALHEWFGLLGYWLTGKTDTLFPGP